MYCAGTFLERACACVQVCRLERAQASQNIRSTEAKCRGVGRRGDEQMHAHMGGGAESGRKFLTHRSHPPSKGSPSLSAESARCAFPRHRRWQVSTRPLPYKNDWERSDLPSYLSLRASLMHLKGLPRGKPFAQWRMENKRI